MKYIYFIGLLVMIGCKENSTNYESDVEEVFGIDGYSDGTYCAQVDYYYSQTGTSSTYTLEVEVENNELTVIHWPNGGWLDSSHFTPQDISSGEASFTSDAGVDYIVTITGSGGDCLTSSYAKNEDDLLREQETSEREEEASIRQKIEDQENEDRKIQEEKEEEEQSIRDAEENN